jgi:hypothetical protein
MPAIWKAAMVVLVVCLLASMVIGTVRLATTPDQILGAGFKGWPGKQFPR